MKKTGPRIAHETGVTTLIMGAALLACAASANAATLPVSSYDMINGAASTPGLSLRDDTYTGGTGNPGENYSTLAGGKGDLTDGLIAASNWNITPAEFVGWSQLYVPSPEITFHFAQVVDISDVSIHMNWGYSASSVDFSVDRTTWINRVINLPNPPTGANFQAGFADLGLTGDTLVMRLNDRSPFYWNTTLLSADWILISEVSIEGSLAPIPEPTVTSLLLAGIGVVCFAAYRRSRPGMLPG